MLAYRIFSVKNRQFGPDVFWFLVFWFFWFSGFNRGTALLMKFNFLSFFQEDLLFIILLILGDPGAVYKGVTIFPFVLPLDLRG